MNEPREVTVDASRVIRKQTLLANIIRACTHCGAPGYWHDTPGVNVGCYAPEKVTKLGEDAVGLVCPNCGTDRPGIEPRGVIWSKTWRASLWSMVGDAIADLFKPFWRTRA